MQYKLTHGNRFWEWDTAYVVSFFGDYYPVLNAFLSNGKIGENITFFSRYNASVHYTLERIA